MDIVSVIYQNIMWIAGGIVVAVLAFFVFSYIRTRKMPTVPIQYETELGLFRIIVCHSKTSDLFEGVLYTFSSFLESAKAKPWEESLDKETLVKIKTCLDQSSEVHCYAMRQGMKKIGFIDVGPSLETKFTTQEGYKLVIAERIGSVVALDYEYVSLTPIDQKDWTLDESAIEKIEGNVQTAVSLRQGTPLVEQLNAEQEKNRVMQSKVDQLADEVGRLKDEVEYWKYEAKRGIEKVEAAFQIPNWIKTYVPYAILFIIGYGIAPQVTTYHPALVGVGLVLAGFIVRKLLKK
jgi:uncharacterized protein YlzI (FlbEa/FlbD family)